VIEAYEHFFSRYTASDLLVIDTSQIDFVHNNRDLQALFQRLDAPVKGTQHFLMVG
jgi:deoxyadenosine/deoxycytidine kinase